MTKSSTVGQTKACSKANTPNGTSRGNQSKGRLGYSGKLKIETIK